MKTEEKLEIVAISNKYKDIQNNLIDRLDKEFSDLPKLIDKESCNPLKSKNSSMGLSKRNYYLDGENVLNILLRLAPKTRGSQVYQRYDVILFSLKSEGI